MKGLFVPRGLTIRSTLWDLLLRRAERGVLAHGPQASGHRPHADDVCQSEWRGDGAHGRQCHPRRIFAQAYVLGCQTRGHSPSPTVLWLSG